MKKQKKEIKVYPKPVVKQFPGLLDLPVPNILIYPKEAIIEQIHKEYGSQTVGVGSKNL